MKSMDGPYSWKCLARRGQTLALMLIGALCGLTVQAQSIVQPQSNVQPQAQAKAQTQAQAVPPPHLLSAQGKGRQIGAAVIDLASGAALLTHQPDEPLNPASTMKLVTTYAALNLLGPDYRWRTQFYLGRPLQGDVLAGDLIVRGGGDPKLVIEDLQEVVRQLRQRGLREIQGDLLIETSLYDIGPVSVEAFDGDPTQPYNVRPHAALMNFKATNFIITPGDAGVTVRMDPELADVRLEVQVRQVGGPCRHGASSLMIADDGNPSVSRIKVAGQYSAACGEQGTYVAVLTHQQFIHGLFKAAWQAAGGSFVGHTRLVSGLNLRGQSPFHEWESPRTLIDVVRDINKFSNNVMARQLLLQVAHETMRLPATPERARQAIQQWLGKRQMHFRELHIDNGSGLSRSERISAMHLAQLLRDAAFSPVAAPFRDSLPVVGVDGTMKSRLKADPVAGNAAIKTGSLNAVRAIAGYVKAQSGRDLAVVMIINGAGAEGTQALQDQLLRWAYQQ